MEKLAGNPLRVMNCRLLGKLIGFLILLFAMASCMSTKEIKIVSFNDNQIHLLEDIKSYMNSEIELINIGDYWIVKNINAEMLLEIAGIASLKTDIISDNIANASTTKTDTGGPYIRKLLRVTAEKGVEIIEDMENPPRVVYDPTHPDAITTGEMEGYVKMPNVDVVTEMTDMIEASRLYEFAVQYLEKRYNYIVF
jgi:flagellar basal-body rod protein FlgC